MVVLVTNREDLTADFVVAELSQRRARFERFNTEDYPSRVRLQIAAQTSQLTIGDQTIVAEQIATVWWRRPLPPALPETYTREERDWAAAEAQAAIEGFWHAVSGRWVNHPFANLSASSKPEQLRRATRHGLRVPPTVITNEPAVATDFARKQNRIVCKPLANGVVPDRDGSRIFYTELMTNEDVAALTGLGEEPYLFQALIDKVCDVRVTVVGGHAYGSRIESQDTLTGRIDWRKAELGELQHSVCSLPDDLAASCISLAHSYGLRYAAIDLALARDNSYVFFELNPNGEWGWLQQHTALPLAQRLVDELLSDD